VSTQQERRGKSTFAGNPFANRKSPILARVLLKKLRREGGLKDGLEAEARPGEQFNVGPAAVDHGKPSGAGNALTFHNWSGDKTPGTEEN
jgi:hypothetical protein